MKEGFKEMFVHIINKDTKGIVDVLIRLRVILPTTKDTSDIELFLKQHSITLKHSMVII